MLKTTIKTIKIYEERRGEEKMNEEERRKNDGGGWVLYCNFTDGFVDEN